MRDYAAVKPFDVYERFLGGHHLRALRVEQNGPAHVQFNVSLR